MSEKASAASIDLLIGSPAYRASCVAMGQSSVLKGDAGKPSRLNRLAEGLLAQRYRTAAGLGIAAERTTTVSPTILASAATNLRSNPAIANPASEFIPFRMVRPEPM